MSEALQSNISKKLEQLDEYVAWFEGDQFDLEQALDKFADAKKLAADIQLELDELKNKIVVVKKQFDKE